MKVLVAKPIVNDQFWIITDGEKKVGNIEANNNGYNLNLNGSKYTFDSTNDIKKNINITFQSLKTIQDNVSKNSIYEEYPKPEKIYNSIVDVQKGIHLFTKTQKSKCYHAAGYYVLEQDVAPTIVFCPKYIFLQRYKFKGPFKSLEEAKSQLNTL